MGINRFFQWLRHYYTEVQQSTAPIVKHGPGGDFVFGMDPKTGQWVHMPQQEVTHEQ